MTLNILVNALKYSWIMAEAVSWRLLGFALLLEMVIDKELEGLLFTICQLWSQIKVITTIELHVHVNGNLTAMILDQRIASTLVLLSLNM